MKIVAFFIRHGETDMNKKDEFRGDEDIDLDETGQAQAQELVPYFDARDFSAAFHSDKKRTKQTIGPLAEAHGMQAVELPGLDSLNTGDFTGLPKTAANKKKLDWYREHPDVVIPGGESVQNFRNDTDPAIMKVIRIGEEAGKPAIAATHGSVMRELSRMFHNGDYNAIKVEPGGIVGVFKKRGGGYDAKALVRENPAEEDIQPGS